MSNLTQNFSIYVSIIIALAVKLPHWKLEPKIYNYLNFEFSLFLGQWAGVTLAIEQKFKEGEEPDSTEYLFTSLDTRPQDQMEPYDTMVKQLVGFFFWNDDQPYEPIPSYCVMIK